MAKTHDERLAERLAEIQKLVAEKARIEDRLMELTGIRTKTDEKPKDFSLMDEIQEVIDGASSPMSAKQISDAIAEKTGYDPTGKNVRATGKYMVTKDRIAYDDAAKTFLKKNP